MPRKVTQKYDMRVDEEKRYAIIAVVIIVIAILIMYGFTSFPSGG